MGSFFRAVWRGLDALRRFLSLLVLLALLGIVIGALRQGGTPRVPDKAALVVRPSGDIVEQLSGEPFERAIDEAQGSGEPQTLLWDLTTAIRAAASDSRIAALFIDTDDMDRTGQVKLEEVAAAIGEFRKSGKKIVAYGNYYLQSQYYLAAQADEVYLDPFGFLLLDGYDRYRMYLKDVLEKLGVDMHLFRVGKFKSAAETYTRHDMSSEDRQESEAYLSALWHGYLESVAGARHTQAEAISQYATGYVDAVTAADGDASRVAKDSRLVTDLKTRQEVEQRLIELVGADPSGKTYRQISVSDYLRATHADDKQRGKGAAVGVVVASGEILDGKQPPGYVGGESTAALLRQARLDDDIHAVVLRVDSPGGSVLASEQIYREVLALKQAHKPVVASMSDLAASGGYYIAVPADEIIASANTITGSIGVFASIPTFNRTLAKVGINVDGIGTTPLSGAIRLDRPLSEGASKLLQSTVDHTYEQFLARVAAGRGKQRDAVDAIAQGRVWAGADALPIGLVDKIGDYDDAVREAARRGGLSGSYGVRRIEPELGWAQQLLLQLRSTGDGLLERFGLLHGDAATLSGLARRVAPLDRELTRWARLSDPHTVYAYCFCSAD
ncbi:MAG TPA: signal peptide peptidase SppA [Steroidobacteraceae bacterium]|jgi:protease-4